MAAPQIGFLVPLNQNLHEDTTITKLPLVKGANFIGRDSISLLDKRLSRKHITLTASIDGFADLAVEGTNPVVVKSGGERKKILSKGIVKIKHGDFIELIPGHHLYKYVSMVGEKTGSCNDAAKRPDSDGRKRRWEVSGDEGLVKMENDVSVEEKSLSTGNSTHSLFKRPCNKDAIRRFNVTKDKIPSTFRLLRVRELPAWANTSSVSIADVIQGDVVVALLSNYMVDMDWLFSACPKLAQVPRVLVIHGEGDGALDHMKRKKPLHWILHKPPLPISYGTHHSKAMILVYPLGVRIIVHTANLIFVDWNNKSQGLWMQDFPWKDQKDVSNGCGFETDLIDYLSVLKWPEFTVSIPGIGNCNINSSFFKKFDYSDATVRLIGSVPGYHNGSNLKRWGHMKLRTVLQENIFDNEFKKSPLIYQFSSLGSLDEKWMAEFASSMSSGVSEDKTPLGMGKPQIIWPTVEDVRCSLEGYAAGNAVPGPQKNVEKEFLKKYWAKWKASHTGRCRAMPHIKTFTRYSGQKLAWFLLTSANLSKAAWGALQKNNSQLMIRSYELGVLFLPSPVKQHGGHRFSCTYDDSKSKDKFTSTETSKVERTKLVTLTWEENKNNIDSSNEVVTLPVPYELPPLPYTSEDIPWSWDRQYHKKDVYGQVWPRQVQLYSSYDS